MNPGSPPPTTQECKYWAFISYSHQDNLFTRGDGSTGHMCWADWLHERLETFIIPDGYRDRLCRTGEPMPERFFPVFRDEDELPTNHDLGGQIRQALDSSRFLIVIASPRSARSRYVNEEVLHFRKLGRGDRILVLITSGEPNVRQTPKAGWKAEDECFCPALVHELHEDGSLDESRLMSQEPIAADVRVKGREPTRELRVVEMDEPDQVEMLEHMKLKLIAGLMGVGLDDLAQRDRRRQKLERERRERTLRLWLAAVTTLFVLVIAGGVIAWQQRKQAKASEAKALEQGSKAMQSAQRAQTEEEKAKAQVREASRSDYVTAQQRLADGRWHEALAYLGRSIRYAPENRSAHETLWMALRHGVPDVERCPVLTLERVIHSVGYQTTGSLIATADDDFTVRVWDSATGQFLAGPLKHPKQVGEVAFSPDGIKLATKFGGDTIWVWNLRTGAREGETMVYSKPVTRLQFSPDGTRLLTYGGEAAQLWDAQTGKMLGNRLEHHKAVADAAFSPDGMRCATITEDGWFRIWNAATGDPLSQPLQQHTSLDSVCFSPDGTRLLTQGKEVTVREVEFGKAIGKPIKHDEGVFQSRGPIWIKSACFSPDGARIVTAGSDGAAFLWDATSGSMVAPEMKEEGKIVSASFSHDGSRVVTVGEDNTVHIWDAIGGRPLGVPLRHRARVRSASFNPSGTHLLTVSEDRNAYVWDLRCHQGISAQVPHVHPVHDATFSPDGTLIATGSGDRDDTKAYGSAQVWEIKTGTMMAKPLPHDGLVDEVCFTPDQSRLLTRAPGLQTKHLYTERLLWELKTQTALQPNAKLVAAIHPAGASLLLRLAEGEPLRFWDTDTKKARAEHLAYHDKYAGAAYSPDGERVVLWGDSLIRVWNTQSQELILQAADSAWPTDEVIFSQDGNRLLLLGLKSDSAGNAQPAQVWDISSKQPLGEPALHGNRGPLLGAFSHDGRHYATAGAFMGSEPGTMTQVREVESGRTIGVPMKHSNEINTLCFSPDDRHVLTSCKDGKARLWDAVTGYPLGVLMPHRDSVTSAMFSPDGRQVLTSSLDKTARLWDVAPAQWLETTMVDDLVAFCGGAWFDPQTGSLRQLQPEDRLRLWRKLEPALNSFPDWLLAARLHISIDPAEQSLSPRMSLRVRDAATSMLEACLYDIGHTHIYSMPGVFSDEKLPQRILAGDTAALDMLRADPAHPLLPLVLARVEQMRDSSEYSFDSTARERWLLKLGTSRLPELKSQEMQKLAKTLIAEAHEQNPKVLEAPPKPPPLRTLTPERASVESRSSSLLNKLNSGTKIAQPLDIPPSSTPYPKGIPIPGKPGMVLSPHASDSGPVDVSDSKPGQKVRCPFTGRVFLVP